MESGGDRGESRVAFFLYPWECRNWIFQGPQIPCMYVEDFVWVIVYALKRCVGAQNRDPEPPFVPAVDWEIDHAYQELLSLDDA